MTATYNNAQRVNPGFKLKALSATLLLVAGSTAVQAQSTSGAEPMLEEIVVKGIRASMESASELKRNAAVVVDAITAEDVGKFPDPNVAEALQRVTGVQISRDRGGEGRWVSIRGLSSQYNMTLLNGRTLATDNAGRDFSFDVMPSEAISGAEVYKTSMASLPEGSIGGLVNLTTAKPLDNPGLRASGSAGAFYDGATEDWTGQYSGVLSNTFLDDTVGASVGISYYKRNWRANTFDSFTSSTELVDANNDGVKEEAVDGRGIFPGIISYQTKFGERERLGFTGALQFRPNDNFETTLDGFYSNYKTPESAYSFNVNFYSNDGWDRFENYELEPYNGDEVDRWLISSFDLTNIPLEIGTDTKAREAETYMVGWNSIWNVRDDLELTFDIAYSEADRPINGTEYYTVAGLNGGNFSFEATPEVPTVTCVLDDGRNCLDVTNDEIGLHFMEPKGESVNDKALSVRFDGDYRLESVELIDSIEFGVTYSGREKDKVNWRPDNACGYCGFGDTLGEVGIDAVVPFPGEYEYDSGFDSWPALDPIQLFQAARLHRGDEYFRSNILAQPELRSSALIEEDVSGGYIQANFEGNRWSGNVGGRWVYTETLSMGHSQQLLELQEIPNSTNWNAEFTEVVPVSESNSYDNFLPSANFTYELSEEYLVRASASRSITRPTISQLGPDVNWEVNSPPPRVNRNGNPELEPFVADSLDLSLEWYGGGGSSAAIALFYKDIGGLITSEQFGDEFQVRVVDEDGNASDEALDFEVTAPVNGDSAKVFGSELAYQYLFDNGFGVMANFTWVDSEAELTVDGEKIDTELSGVSEYTYNLAGIYERGPVSSRLAWSYRDEFTACNTCAPGGRPTTTKEFGSLDFSASYEITDNLSVYLEGQNLLEEDNHTYSQDVRITQNYEAYSRRFEIGVRASF
ncbi:TonB-dependent receptor [Marinimicrobium sp. LS-A18]|uniref:TonB-dependent receptor n=1 Tax=Marinimicrobium sp. LS-A18 TaxID=1381596 RepID=UPI000467AC04|nr:TonB-dependent receptor [Marinimicrobium sp. LS-A18]